MASVGLRVEDRLDRGGNWTPWKAKIVLLLEENELWEIVESAVTLPTEESAVTLPIDPILPFEFKKKNVRAKRIILDSVKDHIILHVFGKDYAYQMWESLSNLYQSSNQNWKMVLREKLRSTKMARGETVTSYLTRVSQVQDELAAVGEVVDSAELIRAALDGFSKSWESFARGIVSRENMASWERVWDDFVQEELRVGSTSTSLRCGGREKDTVALATE